MGSSASPGRKSLAASYEGTGNRGPQRRATDDPSQMGCSSLFLFRGGGPLGEESLGSQFNCSSENAGPVPCPCRARA